MSASARGCFPRKKQKECERRQTSAGQTGPGYTGRQALGVATKGACAQARRVTASTLGVF